MGEAKSNPTAIQAKSRPHCSSCPHFFDNNWCRRLPPLPMMVPKRTVTGQMDLQLQSFWPPTGADRWCGEHPDFPQWFAMDRIKTPEQKSLEQANVAGTG